MPVFPIFAAILTLQILASAERQQFSSCLRAYVDQKVAEGLPAADFEAAIATACRNQEASFRAAYIAGAIRAGDSRSAAERNAGLEVDDLRANYVEIFHSANPG